MKIQSWLLPKMDPDQLRTPPGSTRFREKPRTNASLPIEQYARADVTCQDGKVRGVGNLLESARSDMDGGIQKRAAEHFQENGLEVIAAAACSTVGFVPISAGVFLASGLVETALVTIGAGAIAALGVMAIRAFSLRNSVAAASVEAQRRNRIEVEQLTQERAEYLKAMHAAALHCGTDAEGQKIMAGAALRLMSEQEDQAVPIGTEFLRKIALNPTTPIGGVADALLRINTAPLEPKTSAKLMESALLQGGKTNGSPLTALADVGRFFTERFPGLAQTGEASTRILHELSTHGAPAQQWIATTAITANQVLDNARKKTAVHHTAFDLMAKPAAPDATRASVVGQFLSNTAASVGVGVAAQLIAHELDAAAQVDGKPG